MKCSPHCSKHPAPRAPRSAGQAPRLRLTPPAMGRLSGWRGKLGLHRGKGSGKPLVTKLQGHGEKGRGRWEGWVFHSDLDLYLEHDLSYWFAILNLRFLFFFNL